MNLHHLDIFLNVCFSGSLSATAKSMHISQSALSSELKMFEGRLGIALFERLPRGMELTSAGHVLKKYAEDLFAIADSAEMAMREIVDARSGHLSIGASNTPGLYLLPPLILELKNSYPDIDITLFIGNTAQVCQGMLERRFDLGLIEGSPPSADLHWEAFSPDQLIPVTAATNPICQQVRLDATDLQRQCLLLREEGSGCREQTLNLTERCNIRMQRVIEFNQTEAIKQALLAGSGIAWLPRRGLENELASGKLTWLAGLNLDISRTLGVVRRKNSPDNRLTDRLLSRLKGAVSAVS